MSSSAPLNNPSAAPATSVSIPGASSSSSSSTSSSTFPFASNQDRSGMDSRGRMQAISSRDLLESYFGPNFRPGENLLDRHVQPQDVSGSQNSLASVGAAVQRVEQMQRNMLAMLDRQWTAIEGIRSSVERIERGLGEPSSSLPLWLTNPKVETNMGKSTSPLSDGRSTQTPKWSESGSLSPLSSNSIIFGSDSSNESHGVGLSSLSSALIERSTGKRGSSSQNQSPPNLQQPKHFEPQQLKDGSSMLSGVAGSPLFTQPQFQAGGPASKRQKVVSGMSDSKSDVPEVSMVSSVAETLASFNQANAVPYENELPQQASLLGQLDRTTSSAPSSLSQLESPEGGLGSSQIHWPSLSLGKQGEDSSASILRMPPVFQIASSGSDGACGSKSSNTTLIEHHGPTDTFKSLGLESLSALSLPSNEALMKLLNSVAPENNPSSSDFGQPLSDQQRLQQQLSQAVSEELGSTVDDQQEPIQVKKEFAAEKRRSSKASNQSGTPGGSLRGKGKAGSSFAGATGSGAAASTPSAGKGRKPGSKKSKKSNRVSTGSSGSDKAGANNFVPSTIPTEDLLRSKGLRWMLELYKDEIRFPNLFYSKGRKTAMTLPNLIEELRNDQELGERLRDVWERTPTENGAQWLEYFRTHFLDRFTKNANPNALFDEGIRYPSIKQDYNRSHMSSNKLVFGSWYGLDHGDLTSKPDDETKKILKYCFFKVPLVLMQGSRSGDRQSEKHHIHPLFLLSSLLHGIFKEFGFDTGSPRQLLWQTNLPPTQHGVDEDEEYPDPSAGSMKDGEEEVEYDRADANEDAVAQDDDGDGDEVEEEVEEEGENEESEENKRRARINMKVSPEQSFDEQLQRPGPMHNRKRKADQDGEELATDALLSEDAASSLAAVALGRLGFPENTSK